MRKIIRIIGIMAVAIVTFVGCGKSDNNEGGRKTINLQQDKSYCSGLKVACDSQNGEYSRLYYYDYKSGKEIFACGQANCTHDIDDFKDGKINCNAIVVGQIKYPFAYKNKIYYFMDNYNSATLWKCDTDGANKKEITTLDYELALCNDAFYDGNIYVAAYKSESTDEGNNTSMKTNPYGEVFKINIESGKIEQISDVGKNADVAFSYVTGFKNMLYFKTIVRKNSYQEGNFKNFNDYMEWYTSDKFTHKEEIERLGLSDDVYSYNMDNGKLEKMDIGFESNYEPYKGIKNMDSYYVIGYSKDTLYYLDATMGNYTVYSYNLKSGERKELISSFLIIDAETDDKIFLTTLELDEATKDDNLPKAELNKEPEYYIIDMESGKVTKQNYGEKGKILYVTDENEKGLLSYIKDYDESYNTIDEHSLTEIPMDKVK